MAVFALRLLRDRSTVSVMHARLVVRSLAALILGLAGALLIPIVVAFAYGESPLSFLFPLVICAALGVGGLLVRKGEESTVRVQEGATIVVATWIVSCLVGAIPFLLMPEPISFVDALFESSSGFTTTGSTIFADVETLPRSILMWRSLTHWLGGMGIIVLAVAVLPFFGIGGLQLMRAEAPGPDVERLTPRLTHTARLFWGIYLGLTAVETLLLVAGGLDLFDAVNHSFATLATGGFSTRNASIAAFNSPMVEWTVTIFMVLSGVNFALYYRLFLRDFQRVLRDSELKAYGTLFVVSVSVVTLALLSAGAYGGFGETLRYGSFQVATLMTSTGFATADYVLWPGLAQGILLLMLFVGGCVGSTSGGIKMFHVTVLMKASVRELRRQRHPRAVIIPRFNKKPLQDRTMTAAQGFVFLYMALVLVSTIVVASSNTDLETSLTATLAAIGNIGPGFAGVGPTENFGFFPDYVKVWLSFVMVAGRLEIYTILLLITPRFFRKW